MIEKELLSAALSATSEGVIIATVRHDNKPDRIIYGNRAFEKLIGFDNASIINHKYNLLERLSKNTPVTEDEIVKAITAGKSIQCIRKSQTKSGDYFWHELSISPVLDESGTLTHIIGVLHNINERIHYQEKIEQQNLLLKRKNQQLDELASHDFLTTLYNRRFFDRELTRLCAFHQRYQIPLSLAFFDIDYFKQYNDYYGHNAGDRALRLVAEKINQHFSREADICARYGGEEFVVLSASDSNEATFLKHVEAVRLNIEQLAIPHKKSTSAKVITVSAGIYVAVPLRGMSPNYFTEEADHAMYQAKQLGRNRVAVARHIRMASG